MPKASTRACMGNAGVLDVQPVPTRTRRGAIGVAPVRKDPMRVMEGAVSVRSVNQVITSHWQVREAASTVTQDIIR